MRSRRIITVWLFVFACVTHSHLLGQSVWEYSPYRVKFWLSVSPTLALSPESEQEIHKKIGEFSEVNFGPTWETEVEATPDALFGSVLYRLDEFTVEQLLSRELLLIVGKSEEAKKAFLEMNPPIPKPPTDPGKPLKAPTKAEADAMQDLEARNASLQSVRTLDSAIERIKRIAIQPLLFNAMQRDILPFLETKQWSDFGGIVQPFSGTLEQLQSELASGETVAALIQKMDLDKFKKVARQIPARLPWQPEALLRDHDKVFLASVDKAGESIRIQVKELDSFVRRMGDIASTTVVSKEEIPRAIAELAAEAFSPIVRIEETDLKTAVLRVKAAGLLTTKEYPIRVSPGDVLLPIVRRDDSNGNPTLLQAIPFTFVAVTERIDSVSKLYGAIFTASRGSLSSAKNRRTQRVGLKIKPNHPASELRLGIKSQPGVPFVGAEVYRRTPGSDDLELVGRTDWRGVVPIGIQNLPTIQYEPPKDSKVPAIANARKISQFPVDPPEYKISEAKPPVLSNLSSNAESLNQIKDAKSPSVKETTEPSEGDKQIDAPVAVVKKPVGSMQVHLPLYLYYIKNGETLLARLPIVDGMKGVEQADLPDDRRRLETEALLKGLQGEVLDVVIRRKVLEARIKQEIRKKDFEKAEKMLEELKRVKSFEKMSEQVEAIQRRALAVDRGPMLFGVSKKIETMLDATKSLMQKYLQDTIVRTLETEILNAK